MDLMFAISGIFFVIFILNPPHYIVYFISNYFIVRKLRILISMFPNSKVTLMSQKNSLSSLLIEFIIYVFLYFVARCIKNDFIHVNWLMFIVSFCIWCGIFFLKKLTDSEVSYLGTVNNLTLGYGVAIWYYKNYLDRILPDNFLTRVKQFEAKEGIRLPHKLYILCPKSCKVKQYIDKTDYIESTKNLSPFEIDHGGIKGRKYSVSVYRIENNGKFFYCALEYAQPLKSLRALKENGRITSSEMDIERESFIKNLTQMLRDRENTFEVCELVQYDDESSELHNLLPNLPSIQEYKR